MPRMHQAFLALACALPLTLTACNSSQPTPTEPAPQPAKAPAAEPASVLQGDWNLVSFIKDTKTISAGESMARKLMINDKRYILTGAKEIGNMPIGTFTLQPTQTPKSITIVADAKEGDGKVRFGIYDFTEADMLRIALADPGQPKPTGFSPAKGVSVLVFKRIGAPK
jgi:uncharacterized protein (TIGR03067 family)